MKKTIFLLSYLFFGAILFGQIPKGTVVVDALYSKNLENTQGENPTRQVSIYLPPDYAASTKSYPVIYYLHGFLGDHQLRPSMIAVLDQAIADHKMRPFILVVPNQKTTYEGSFYSNSELYGNWEDFTAFDLVNYVDNNYRTLKNKMGRGITGHSMGGYGALKIAMHHPDIFSSVYALSPGALTIVAEYGPNSETFKQLAKLKTDEALKKSYFPKVIVALGKSWSPNANKPPFFCDLPFEYKDGEMITHPEVLEKWQKNMPVHMIEENLERLQQLTAIKFDWGRNAGIRFVQQCEMFSRRLENSGIKHFAEEYIGTHTSAIFTPHGRVPDEMLPFFNTYLSFEN